MMTEAQQISRESLRRSLGDPVLLALAAPGDGDVFDQGLNWCFQEKSKEAIAPLKAALRLDPKESTAREHLRVAVADMPSWTELVFALARIDAENAPRHQTGQPRKGAT
jgi:hypothetical protein